MRAASRRQRRRSRARPTTKTRTCRCWSPRSAAHGRGAYAGGDGADDGDAGDERRSAARWRRRSPRARRHRRRRRAHPSQTASARRRRDAPAGALERGDAIVGIVLVLRGRRRASSPTSSSWAAARRTAKVTTVVATPREVVRLYDGAGRGQEVRGQTLSFGEAGKVTTWSPRAPRPRRACRWRRSIRTPKIEKELADVKDRAGFYEKQLAAAKAKNDDEGAKAAEAKVAEKKKLLGELEARAAKVRLVAPGPGTVAQVMVPAGGDAKAGAPVVRLADKRSIVDFKVSRDAAALKAGGDVSLQPAGGRRRRRGARGEGRGRHGHRRAPRRRGGQGRAIRCAWSRRACRTWCRCRRRRWSSATAPTVFVFGDGMAHERKVTVVDTDGQRSARRQRARRAATRSSRRAPRISKTARRPLRNHHSRRLQRVGGDLRRRRQSARRHDDVRRRGMRVARRARARARLRDGAQCAGDSRGRRARVRRRGCVGGDAGARERACRRRCARAARRRGRERSAARAVRRRHVLPGARAFRAARRGAGERGRGAARGRRAAHLRAAPGVVA